MTGITKIFKRKGCPTFDFVCVISLFATDIEKSKPRSTPAIPYLSGRCIWTDGLVSKLCKSLLNCTRVHYTDYKSSVRELRHEWRILKLKFSLNFSSSSIAIRLFPILTILVPVWFVVASLVLFYLILWITVKKTVI